MSKTIFSKRLKQARKNKHMTQQELAKHINISTSAIANYEQALTEPSEINTLRIISNVLNVSLDWLLGSDTIICLDDNFVPIERQSKLPLIDGSYTLNTKLYANIVKYIDIIDDNIDLDFATFINDNSLEPHCFYNDIVFIKKEKPKNHDIIYCINNNNEILIRQLLINNGKSILHCFNTKYEDVELTDHYTVIGVAKKIQTNL